MEEQNSEDSISKTKEGNENYTPTMEDLIEEAKMKDEARDRMHSDMNLNLKDGRNRDSLMNALSSGQAPYRHAGSFVSG